MYGLVKRAQEGRCVCPPVRTRVSLRVAHLAEAPLVVGDGDLLLLAGALQTWGRSGAEASGIGRSGEVYARGRRKCKQRDVSGSNRRGHGPMDFKSISLTTRTTSPTRAHPTHDRLKACAHLLDRVDVKDAVGVDVEGHVDLRLAARHLRRVGSRWVSSSAPHRATLGGARSAARPKAEGQIETPVR